MLSPFEIIAVLLVLTAAFAWINQVSIRLPNTVGLLLMGLAASLVVVGFELAFPDVAVFHELNRVVREIDFPATLLHGMLAFLLFAGALHVNTSRLRHRRWIVGAMATVGVLISTGVVAGAFWLVSTWLGTPMPFAWALVFGALISPTDPVAVLGALKEVRVSESLEMDMAGESLFNDGVGVVFFTVLLAAATDPGETSGVARFAELFLAEAAGGAALGLLAGYLAYRSLRLIDDYPIEILISLAVATGTYALALNLHVSGPIAVVCAGLLIGNSGVAHAMSEATQRYLLGFWDLTDEILNSILFLLIGLEVLVLRFDWTLLPLALSAIVIVLGARLLAVSAPVLALSARRPFERGTIPVLTWGGVRGGISVALALSIPNVPEKPALLMATYSVAVWTLVVQGLTLGRVAKHFCSTAPARRPDGGKGAS